MKTPGLSLLRRLPPVSQILGKSDRGFLSLAVRDNRTAASMQPQDFWANYYLAMSLKDYAKETLDLAVFREAESAFSTCLAIWPDEPTGWIERGALLRITLRIGQRCGREGPIAAIGRR